MIGFIILRHVNSELTNLYWNESYNCIRKYYPTNMIMIIDDRSNYYYVKCLPETKLNNCIIIQSEYPGKAEILPYYYFYKYKFCEKAFFIHDSVFVQKYINFNENTNIDLLWKIKHDWDNHAGVLVEISKNLLSKLNDGNKLISFYENPELWDGCFGVMSGISLNFLEKIVEKYNLFVLLDHINDWNCRAALERIIPVIFYFETSPNIMFGDIHDSIKWGYKFENYLIEKNNINSNEIPLVKVWSGR